MTRKRYQKLSRAFGLRLLVSHAAAWKDVKTGKAIHRFANARPRTSYAQAWADLCKNFPNITEGIGTENERKNSRKIQTAGGVYHV